MTDIMKCTDIRMRKAGDSPGFSFEALTESWIRGEMRSKNLHCDDSVQPGVICPIDFPHSARTQGRKDFVWPQLRSRRNRHCGSNLSQPLSRQQRRKNHGDTKNTEIFWNLPGVVSCARFARIEKRIRLKRLA